MYIYIYIVYVSSATQGLPPRPRGRQAERRLRGHHTMFGMYIYYICTKPGSDRTSAMPGHVPILYSCV